MEATTLFTISQVAKKYNLSRSTLLYYDKINLLKPSGRSQANYRLYSASDLEAMEKISMYRSAGLSLENISEILNSEQTDASNILENRLLELHCEMASLREQQRNLISLLGKDSSLRTTHLMDKDQWVKILRATGMNDEAMHKWHIEFERQLPEMHKDFLESLGCDEEEVKRIRAWSRSA